MNCNSSISNFIDLVLNDFDCKKQIIIKRKFRNDVLKVTTFLYNRLKIV